MTAVCTTRPETAEEARKAFGAKLAFHDFREMVASPEIDAVAVVVRVPLHYEPTKAAIEAGKHVYTEWPLGRTTAEAEELAALARAKGRADRGRPAIAGQPGAAVHEGADRSRLRGRGAVLSRRLHARRRAGAPVQPHLAARCQPRREHADHRQRPRHRRAALRRGQLRARGVHGHDPGAAMVRDRHQADGGRHLAGQRAGQRQARERRGGVGPRRGGPLGRQRLSDGDLRPGRHAGRHRQRLVPARRDAAACKARSAATS